MTAQSRAARRRSMRSMPGAARMAARFQRPRQPITPSATPSEAAAQPSVVAPPSPVAEVVAAAPVVEATPAAAPVTTTAAVEATPVVEATPAAAPPAVAELSAPVVSTAAVEATPVVEATPIVAATPLAHVTAAEPAALVEAAPIPAAEAAPPVAATPAMTKATRRRRSASRNRRPSANRGEATPAPAPPTTMGVSAATATVPLAPTTEPAVAEAPVAQVEAPTPTATTEEAKPRRFFSALGEPPQELPSAAGAAPLTDATTGTPPPLPAAATLAHATTAPPPPATPAAPSRARMSRRPQRRRYTVTAAAGVPPAAAVEPPQSAQPKQVAAPPPAAAEAPTSVVAEAAAPATAAVETAPPVESAPTQHRRPVMSRSVLRKNKRMTVGAAAAAPSITEVSAEAKEADVPAPEISAATDAAISAPVDDSAHHSETAVEPVAEAPKPRTFFVELDTLPTGMEAPSTATATVEAESAAQGAFVEEPPRRPTARAVMRPNFRKRQKTSTPATVDDAPASNTSAEAVPMEQPEERSDVSGKAEESETVMNPEDTPVVDASTAADVSLNEATPPVEVVEVPEAVSAVEAPEVVLDVSELLTDEDIHQSAAAPAVDAQTAHVVESSVVDPFTMIAEAHTIPVAAVEAPKATRASRRRVPKKKTKATQRNRFLAKLKEYEQHANHHPTQDNHVAPVVAEAVATSSLPSATPANGEDIEGHHDAKDRVEKATEREPVSTPHEDESSATPVANDTPVDKPLIVKRATARKKIKSYQALSAQRTAAPETAVATEEAVNEAAPHAEAPTGESGDAAPAFLTFPCDNVVLETFNENEMVARRSSLDDPWDIGLRYDWNVRALAIGSLPTFKETDPRQKHPFLQRFHARPAWHLHEVNGVKASQLSDVMAVLGKSLHARFVFRR